MNKKKEQHPYDLSRRNSVSKEPKIVTDNSKVNSLCLEQRDKAIELLKEWGNYRSNEEFDMWRTKRDQFIKSIEQ